MSSTRLLIPLLANQRHSKGLCDGFRGRLVAPGGYHGFCRYANGGGIFVLGGMDCEKTDGPTKQSVSLQAVFSYHIDFDIYNDEGKRLYIPEESQPPPLLMLWLIAAPD